jgi:peptidoglycan/LPS O-acetylase OafA/YrhL
LRITHLDGWRGLAIVFVLFAHFAPIPWISSGDLGVHVFFVLSGMLMANILFVKRPPLSKFYWRRVSRIFPVFWLFLLVIFTYSYFAGLNFTSGELLSTLAFTRSYFPAFPTIWGSEVPLGHIWSLNVEEHTYIVLSLLTLVAAWRKKEWLALLALGFCTIVIGFLYLKQSNPPPLSGLRTEVASGYIFFSAGYSLIAHRFRRFVFSWLPLLVLVLTILCYTKLAPWWAKPMFTPLALAFVVNHLAETPAFFIRFLSWKPLCSLGIWSYSIYLWQQPFFVFKEEFPSTWLALGCALAVGILSFHAFEDPVRSWLNSRYRPRKPQGKKSTGAEESLAT